MSNLICTPIAAQKARDCLHEKKVICFDCLVFAVSEGYNNQAAEVRRGNEIIETLKRLIKRMEENHQEAWYNCHDGSESACSKSHD